MKSLLPLLFLAQACGPSVCAEATVFTDLGLCLFPNGHPVETTDVDNMVRRIQSAVGDYLGNDCAADEVPKQFGDIAIHIMDYGKVPYGNTGTTEYWDGVVVDDGYIVYFAESLCSSFGVAIHELLHVFQHVCIGIDGEEYDASAHPVGWFQHPKHTAEQDLSENCLETWLVAQKRGC